MTPSRSLDKINIFEYTDYRRYLSDYYQFQKSHTKVFSYRFFAKKAGLSSSGFYKELIDGKRSLSRALIEKFSDALKHNKKEAEYFECMVYFTEAKTVNERKLYFKMMMGIYESKPYKVLADQYEYFSKWYYVAIRELLAFHSYKGDYKALARTLNPPIRPDQAKKAIEILKRLKFIKSNGDGSYGKIEATLTTGSSPQDLNINLLNIINFQKTMLSMAQEAYDRHPLKKIDMSTLTLSVSDDTYQMMKEEISDFRKKLLNMAIKDKQPDRLYQLNYNLFPLTKVKETE